MTTYQLVTSGRSLDLLKPISTGGEGTVWITNYADQVAKIYTQPTPERITKLKQMLANPPQDPTEDQRHISIAWPQDLIRDPRSRAVVGFTMPRIQDAVTLTKIYHPRHRRRILPGFNWFYLHVTALNICYVMQSLHQNGYVIGDVNSKNILVNRRALISIIDTDSFQVPDPESKTVYPCTVGIPEYTPPELFGLELAEVLQDESHDCFGLAVLIYQLLFGSHPYQGKWIGEGDPPDPVEFMRLGLWPYGSQATVEATPGMIPLDIVHPDLQKCFLQTFNHGHGDPSQRVPVGEWGRVLKAAIDDLAVCSRESNHRFSQIRGNCYWCERIQHGGQDPFAKPVRAFGEVNSVTGSVINRLGSLQAPPLSAPTSVITASLNQPIDSFEQWANRELQQQRIQVLARQDGSRLVVTMLGPMQMGMGTEAANRLIRHMKIIAPIPTGVETMEVYGQFGATNEIVLYGQASLRPLRQRLVNRVTPLIKRASQWGGLLLVGATGLVVFMQWPLQVIFLAFVGFLSWLDNSSR